MLKEMNTAEWIAALLALLAVYLVLRAIFVRPPEGGTKLSLAHWRWPLILIPFALAGWAVAISVSERLAFRDYAEPILLAGGEERGRYEWAVIIGRRAERRDVDDEGTPYRNSPLALYQRVSDTDWEKRRGDLLCRSTSTTSRPPQDSDSDAVRTFTAEREVPYRWGHASVPRGVFSLTPTPWRTGDTAFLISALYGSDGTIALEAPQTLTVATLVTDEATGNLMVIVDPDIAPIVSYVKEWCHLHPSHTLDWSHRDSLGCINLCAEADGDEISDYAQFFSWFEELDLLEQPVALVVASFEDFAGPGSEEQLPPRLTQEDFPGEID